MSDRIFIFADWIGTQEPIFLGTLHSRRSAGKENFEFSYDELALQNPLLSGVQIDPRIFPYAGAQYCDGKLPNFGAFSDASPDRWGRLLIKRKHDELIRKGKIDKSARLFESDYLLGAHDRYRVGALRSIRQWPKTSFRLCHDATWKKGWIRRKRRCQLYSFGRIADETWRPDRP